MMGSAPPQQPKNQEPDHRPSTDQVLPQGMRIGYVPASPLLDAPADRRRFVGYAGRRGYLIEIANPRERYDLVVLSQRADLTEWSRYRHEGTRIVFDSVDSYLQANDWKARLRGTSMFLTRRSRRLQVSYREAVKSMYRRADAVICSTHEQATEIRKHCDNVRLILDLQDDDVWERKRSYQTRDSFNVVWEGLASSGIPLSMLREILEPAARDSDIRLHLVTDLEYYKYHDRFVKRRTSADASKVMRGARIKVFLYQWNPLALSRIATGADLAIIPIDHQNAFQWGKPENKLVLFWRMAVPVLTSATPAYERAMRLAGLDMTCSSIVEWTEKLAYYRLREAARRHAGDAGHSVSRSHYSTEEMLRRWDQLLASLFSPEPAVHASLQGDAG